jgi:hypothetical protein
VQEGGKFLLGCKSDEGLCVPTGELHLPTALLNKRAKIVAMATLNVAAAGAGHGPGGMNHRLSM